MQTPVESSQPIQAPLNPLPYPLATPIKARVISHPYPLATHDVPVLVPSALSPLQSQPTRCTFQTDERPRTYMIDPLFNQNDIIPRRCLVDIDGLGPACWFDRIIDIDLSDLGYVVMEGWIFTGFVEKGWNATRFHAKVSCESLDLPYPWRILLNNDPVQLGFQYFHMTL